MFYYNGYVFSFIVYGTQKKYFASFFYSMGLPKLTFFHFPPPGNKHLLNALFHKLKSNYE